MSSCLVLWLWVQVGRLATVPAGRGLWCAGPAARPAGLWLLLAWSSWCHKHPNCPRHVHPKLLNISAITPTPVFFFFLAVSLLNGSKGRRTFTVEQKMEFLCIFVHSENAAASVECLPQLSAYALANRMQSLFLKCLIWNN